MRRVSFISKSRLRFAFAAAAAAAAAFVFPSPLFAVLVLLGCVRFVSQLKVLPFQFTLRFSSI